MNYMTDYPEYVLENGVKEWYLIGKYHTQREYGPAVEKPANGKAWYINTDTQ